MRKKKVKNLLKRKKHQTLSRPSSNGEGNYDIDLMIIIVRIVVAIIVFLMVNIILPLVNTRNKDLCWVFPSPKVLPS